MNVIGLLDSFTLIFLLAVTYLIVSMILQFLNLKYNIKGSGMLALASFALFATFLMYTFQGEVNLFVGSFIPSILITIGNLLFVLGVLSVMGYRLKNIYSLMFVLIATAFIAYFTFQNNQPVGRTFVIGIASFIISSFLVMRLVKDMRKLGDNVLFASLGLLYSANIIAVILRLTLAGKSWHTLGMLYETEFYTSTLLFMVVFAFLQALLIVLIITTKVQKEILLSNSYLQEIANTDSLTGLKNKKFINEALHNEIKRSSRGGTVFSISLLDIDNFKNINDTCGHLFGDKVLIRFSEILTERLRSTDHIGRYGGDEFVIILPETSAKQSKLLFEELQETMFSQEIEDQIIDISFSVGVKEIKGHESIEEIIKEVDTLMYAEKFVKR